MQVAMQAEFQGKQPPDSGILIECYKQQLDYAANLLTSAGLPLPGGTITCITLYNEAGPELQKSLIALMHSLSNHCNCTSSSAYLKSGTFQSHSVAIVADGFENLSETARLLLFNMGFTYTNQNEFNADMAIFYKYFTVKELLKNLIPNTAEFLLSDDVSSDQAFPFYICVKKQNAGKLDSHWWYYKFLCPLIEPEYCFQMDAGTVIAAQSFHKMISHFDEHTSSAALASNVSVVAPGNFFNLLHIWQYGSFQHGLLLEWPAEEYSGYLSVIPGQYSAVRWQALRDESLEHESVYNAIELDYPNTIQPQVNAEIQKPLDIYFRGLGELKPSEAIVYLAEDRVLCNEVAFRDQGRWRLQYVDNAVATTDSCHNLQELLRQRRRWYSSYIGCRIKFLDRLKLAFTRSEIMSRETNRVLSAGAYQTIQLLLDWFFPALLFLVYLGIHNQLKEFSNPLLKNYFSLVEVIMVGLISLQFLCALGGRLNKFSLTIFGAAIAIQSLYLLSSAIVFMSTIFTGGISVVHAQVALIVLSVPIAAALKSHAQLISILKYFLPYTILRPGFALLFWSYAVFNSHDNSWGTKGLHQPKYSSKNSADCHTRRNYVNFRNSFAAIWLTTNIMLSFTMWMALNSSPMSLLQLILGVMNLNIVFSIGVLMRKLYTRKSIHNVSILRRYSSP